MTSVNVNTKGSGHGARQLEALSIAEAGVAEAVARLQAGDIPDTLNPRMVANIFLTSAGSVPVLGADSVALATGQPAGSWLNYSTAGRSPDVLTVTYRTNTARTVIYRYDADANPKIQTTTGNPIFVITSTGYKGNDRRRVVTEVTGTSGDVNIKGALTCDAPVVLTGSSMACGYDHGLNTPCGKGWQVGRNAPGGCNENPAADEWETGDAIAGIWTTSTYTTSSSQGGFGVPDVQTNQTGFCAGPWEALNMTQAEFWTWVGPPQSTHPAIPSGIVHLDNDGIRQNQSGSWSYNDQGSGSGFIYCDGDLIVNNYWCYTGLIYIEGDMTFNNAGWFLGAVISRGIGNQRETGKSTILYSREAILWALNRSTGGMLTLSWREVP